MESRHVVFTHLLLKPRNAPTKLMKDEGYGQNYEMYDEESYLPEKFVGRRYLH